MTKNNLRLTYKQTAACAVLALSVVNLRKMKNFEDI